LHPFAGFDAPKDGQWWNSITVRGQLQFATKTLNQERYMKKQNQHRIQVKDLKARKDVKGGIHVYSSGGSKTSGGSSTTGSSNKQSLIQNTN
jgi:hypothetical protein